MGKKENVLNFWLPSMVEEHLCSSSLIIHVILMVCLSSNAHDHDLPTGSGAVEGM